MSSVTKDLGTFSVIVRLVGPTGDVVDAEALVDTGATYTVVEAQVLRRLGVNPSGKRRFRLADESVKEYEVGAVQLVYDREVVPIVVVFGEGGTPALLGATALENLGLGVDPVNHQLIPADALLK